MIHCRWLSGTFELEVFCHDGTIGGQSGPAFYEFKLEDVVPANHLLRKIDAVLDLSWLRGELSSFTVTRVARRLIRMLIVGYCYLIRWERRLCQEAAMNLAYSWLCCLGIEDKVPSHSSFSVNRHGRFRDGDVLRKPFERILRR